MFLIIQTGDPVASAKQAFGGFDQMFQQAMALEATQLSVVNVHRQQQLPNVAQAKAELTGIVITGSAAMVTHQDEWLLTTQRWLSEIIPQSIPILGVCFGHQVLADMLGGEVAYNPKGRNMGMSQFHFSAAAMDDKLLQEFTHQASIPTFASHLQAVTQLPKSATLLGHCKHDDNHAFRAEEMLWGFQFHPEWSVDITRHYLQARAANLREEQLDPEQMIDQLKPCPEAQAILLKFRQLAASLKA